MNIYINGHLVKIENSRFDNKRIFVAKVNLEWAPELEIIDDMEKDDWNRFIISTTSKDSIYIKPYFENGLYKDNNDIKSFEYVIERITKILDCYDHQQKLKV